MGICHVHFFLPSLRLFFFFLITIISSSYAQNVPTPLSSISAPPTPDRSRDSPFRPSIAIIIAILTTIFSITFLLLLYAKHCKRESSSSAITGGGGGWTHSSSFRKNSGIDRTVIESLPVFRFGSLRGQKAEGLECAVCLNKFESNEILRLLPKCKHAFHVECVDTWLDAHSTCPLCRYQVDPEDILLFSHEISNKSVSSSPLKESVDKIQIQIHSSGSSAPASTRHSSAGEKCTSSSSSTLKVIVETPNEEEEKKKSLSLSRRRMSLDSWNLYRKKSKSTNSSPAPLTRKDGMLLNNKPEDHRRLEHRIVISGDPAPETSAIYRWSDVEACDLLYLRSEMIYSGSRKQTVEIEGRNNNNNNGGRSGRGVINERSVSEMTGMSRFRSNEEEREKDIQRKKGTVKRWLDWISDQSQNKSVTTDNNVSVSGVVTASSSSVSDTYSA